MLQPKKTKFAKRMKGRNRGYAMTGNKVSFGEVGIQSIDRGFINSRQIEATRRAMVRKVRRTGKIWIRIFPDKPITKKPLEVRMGKGKGSVDYWTCVIKPGTMLFEMQGVEEALAREAFILATAKLPVRTKFVKRKII